MEKITSVQNGKIKQISKLVSSSKERKKTGEFVIEGARLCRDAVLSGVEISEAYFVSDAFSKYSIPQNAPSLEKMIIQLRRVLSTTLTEIG